MYRRILVPLDGSATGEQALPLATGLAHRTGAELRLVHALDFGGRLPRDPNDPDDWRGCTQGDADRYLQGIADELKVNPNTRVSVSVRDGAAATAILDDAEQWHADLIVMTTHGRGVIERAWLGSVADTLLRESKLPLLLVRAQGGAAVVRGTRGFQHILVPLDQSELSKDALAPAAALARSEAARMTLLHVIHPWAAPVPALVQAGHTAGLPHSAVLDRTVAAENYLSEIALDLDFEIRGVSADVVVAEWSDSAEILKYACAYGVDLIALATHGRSGFKRAVLGSTADKIIRGADVPVLVLRPRV